MEKDIHEGSSKGLANITSVQNSDLERIELENKNLKKIIGKLTLANDALKKNNDGEENKFKTGQQIIDAVDTLRDLELCRIS